MERFLFIFIHTGLSLLVLIAVLRIRPRSRLALLGNTALYVLLLTFLYLWGQWPLAISLYFKYVLVGIILLALAKCIRRGSKVTAWWPRGIRGWVRSTAAMVMALLLVGPIYQLLDGRTYPEEAVPLTFPLRDGTYYIASGGSNRTINNHYGTAATSQWYALDINKLGAFGMATDQLWATANQAHAIYGEPVYAPCKGRVVEMKYTVPDNESASMDVSPEDGMGNYVVLDCEGVIVSLVHLQHNSVAVHPGQRVLTGDLLGRVGNSGFSQEPHLHFQAARYQADSTLVAVPMQFDGRELVRGDLIKY
ncbi:M23 family metallopeptidase [Robiginitalea sp. SC105]|uniref:M23 family metallopeptidase n=1 Tax=Robiginitalea sp. SC105 TaxID=2762332 RepID=UPI00163AC449|nr:M23 family metallopeptidase [Robiginitalea sp. SC105]MBC2838315.1 M23 family metallopeptidase [Robiginitalea sp. SC105]